MGARLNPKRSDKFIKMGVHAGKILNYFTIIVHISFGWRDMGNTYCVYIHVNKVNNKKYVGMTKYSDPTKRWGGNGYKYKTCIIFYAAIMKYGFDNFDHIILHSNLTKEDAYKKEKEYIRLYKSNNNKFGYNVSEGGQGSNGVSLSVETRKKLSIAGKGRVVPVECREQISNKLKGRTFSDNTLVKMKNSHLGKVLSEEQKKKISVSLGQGVNNVNYGRKRSDEFKRKDSLSHSGAKHFNYGHHLSQETKAKIRDGNSKCVLQFTANGDFILEWKNCKVAAEVLGLSYKAINKCASGNSKTSCGYVWKYKEQ